MKKLICSLLVLAAFISVDEAMNIARKRLASDNVRFKEAELEYEDDYHKTVWSIEAVSGGQEYDIDIDAESGQVLKFKLDD